MTIHNFCKFATEKIMIKNTLVLPVLYMEKQNAGHVEDLERFVLKVSIYCKFRPVVYHMYSYKVLQLHVCDVMK